MRPALALVLLLTACAPAGRLPLRQVTLFGNGLGYFERAGELEGGRLRLRLRPHEIDDVLKTLAVLSDDGAQIGAVAAVQSNKDGATLELTLPNPARRHLRVGYAAPTPAWTPIYRAVLDANPDQGRLQGWAMVSNPSDEDWDGRLVLVTGAPFSLAIDLHTPHFVARPDATGKLITPTLTDAVASQSARPGDRDGDGILDENDQCPDAAEDKDGWEDDDGCPDPDNDNDRILDKNDKCPNQPETYNGYEDEDGCPDKGRVIVRAGHLDILDNIYFTHGSAEVRSMSRPIVDATAATMVANAQILKLEVSGFAADNEPDPMGLSTRRSLAVIAALVRGGVERDRLAVGAYGDTRPIAAGKSDDARARNRVVRFQILKRADGEDAVVATPRALARSVATVQTRVESAVGMVRYSIESAVRVPRRSASLVAILNEPVRAEEVYLYRPLAAVPGSDFSPLRAAHLTGPKGATLEPGAIAIYARGGFVGDAILDRLYPGQTTLVPFALDRSATVRRSESNEREPVRLVSLERGKAVVEDRAVRRTRYQIATGAEAPPRIFVQHGRDALLVPRGLPAGTETTAAALLVPASLKPNDHAELLVEEAADARPRTIDLASDPADALSAYLPRSALPAALKQQLEQALTRRRALADLEKEAARAEEKLTTAMERRAQLDENLHSLQHARGADALRKELSSKLTDAVKLAEAASGVSGKLLAEVNKVRAQLEEQLATLHYSADPKH